MQENTSHLTIEELAEQVDIPVRTVRYYIAEGLLPGPEGRGKATTYSDEHLQRLRLIRLLSRQHRPLTEIHQLLNRLSLAEIRTLLADEEQRARELEPEGQQPPAQEYVATLLKNAHSSGQIPSQRSRRVYESPQVYEDAPAPLAETWHRLELAPGVELHVKEEAGEHYRSLIERLCKTAGSPFQQFFKERKS
jgi:DNA-binding transcriptional MerR regulator